MPEPTPGSSSDLPADRPAGRQNESPASNSGEAAGRQLTGKGPGIVLVALYALFALAATGRATVQIIADFQKAPVSYLLSALAAVIYLVATVALARGDRTSARVARVAISIELAGVLVVGLVSYLKPADFPDKTVWSHFGSGYGYVPLVLPVLGLLWLRRTQAAR
ncbi:hypothetical protein [Lapillicoccus sp.]|uniref:hypothetical protein n=1 Tax=Lapillicoccus sp. TaxID=1909287 RepID=UPI0025FFB745|nr:hypothetical protein [Lapillicoccus sp.]